MLELVNERLKSGFVMIGQFHMLFHACYGNNIVIFISPRVVVALTSREFKLFSIQDRM
jgi:hypothetical protein